MCSAERVRSAPQEQGASDSCCDRLIADLRCMRSATIAFAATLFCVPTAAADHEPCGEPAALYIDTMPLILMPMEETATMYFSSASYSAIQMTFAGGTTAAELVAVINAFTEVHGLTASYDGHGFTDVQIESVAVGIHAFATVAQAGCTAPPLLMNEPGGERLHFITAIGADAAPGDLDCDGVIGAADLLILLNHWGPCPSPYAPCTSDLTLDGAVDVADLLTLLANWGAR